MHLIINIASQKMTCYHFAKWPYHYFHALGLLGQYHDLKYNQHLSQCKRHSHSHYLARVYLPMLMGKKSYYGCYSFIRYVKIVQYYLLYTIHLYNTYHDLIHVSPCHSNRTSWRNCESYWHYGSMDYLKI